MAKGIRKHVYIIENDTISETVAEKVFTISWWKQIKFRSIFPIAFFVIKYYREQELYFSSHAVSKFPSFFVE